MRDFSDDTGHFFIRGFRGDLWFAYLCSGQAGGRCEWVREWAGDCRVWIMSLKSPNQTLETNRRPRSPLGAGQEFERAIYDPAFLSGGGRSALCSA